MADNSDDFVNSKIIDFLEYCRTGKHVSSTDKFLTESEISKHTLLNDLLEEFIREVDGNVEIEMENDANYTIELYEIIFSLRYEEKLFLI